MRLSQKLPAVYGVWVRTSKHACQSDAQMYFFFSIKKMDDFAHENRLKDERNAHRYLLYIVREFHQYTKLEKIYVNRWN